MSSRETLSPVDQGLGQWREHGGAGGRVDRPAGSYRALVTVLFLVGGHCLGDQVGGQDSRVGVSVACSSSRTDNAPVRRARRPGRASGICCLTAVDPDRLGLVRSESWEADSWPARVLSRVLRPARQFRISLNAHRDPNGHGRDEARRLRTGVVRCLSHRFGLGERTRFALRCLGGAGNSANSGSASTGPANQVHQDRSLRASASALGVDFLTLLLWRRPAWTPTFRFPVLLRPRVPARQLTSARCRRWSRICR